MYLHSFIKTITGINTTRNQNVKICTKINNIKYIERKLNKVRNEN